MNSSSLPTITPSPEPKQSPFLLFAVVIVGVFCITFGYVAGSFQLIPKIVEKIGAKNEVACTMEAKLCPDGSYVGRSGPKCEFTPCPETTLIPTGTQSIDIDNSPSQSPTTPPDPKTVSCTQNSDCTINSCSCSAVNKKFLPENQCAMECNGTARCFENTCQYVANPD